MQIYMALIYSCHVFLLNQFGFGYSINLELKAETVSGLSGLENCLRSA